LPSRCCAIARSSCGAGPGLSRVSFQDRNGVLKPALTILGQPFGEQKVRIDPIADGPLAASHDPSDPRPLRFLVDPGTASTPARPVRDWIYPYFLFAKGLAEYRQGRFENAITILKGDAAESPGPGAGTTLAMAQQREGNAQSARATLAAAIGSYDWRLSEADSRDNWMYHILRREAEAAILP